MSSRFKTPKRIRTAFSTSNNSPTTTTTTTSPRSFDDILYTPESTVASTSTSPSKSKVAKLRSAVARSLDWMKFSLGTMGKVGNHEKDMSKDRDEDKNRDYTPMMSLLSALDIPPTSTHTSVTTQKPVQIGIFAALDMVPTLEIDQSENQSTGSTKLDIPISDMPRRRNSQSPNPALNSPPLVAVVNTGNEYDFHTAQLEIRDYSRYPPMPSQVSGTTRP